MRLTGGVAVEGNKVDGTAGDTAEGIGGSELRNAGAQLLRAGEALKTGQVCGQAGDMGGSHGGTGDSVLEEVSLMSLSPYVKTTKKKKEGEREEVDVVKPRKEGVLKLTVEPPIQVERTSVPGAKMSTSAPKLE